MVSWAYTSDTPENGASSSAVRKKEHIERARARAADIRTRERHNVTPLSINSNNRLGRVRTHTHTLALELRGYLRRSLLRVSCWPTARAAPTLLPTGNCEPARLLAFVSQSQSRARSLSQGLISPKCSARYSQSSPRRGGAGGSVPLSTARTVRVRESPPSPLLLPLPVSC